MGPEIVVPDLQWMVMLAPRGNLLNISTFIVGIMPSVVLPAEVAVVAAVVVVVVFPPSTSQESSSAKRKGLFLLMNMVVLGC